MKELTRAEEQIMQVLWELNTAFVNDILEQLPEPRPAYNTVSTIVRILEKKGFVGHKAFGKSHQYHPLIKKKDYTRHVFKGMLSGYFGNSMRQMVSFFAREKNLSIQELEEIKQIIDSEINQKGGPVTMEQFIHFLLRASVYLLLFAVAYQLLFRKQESPGFNRIYLLGSSMMALVLALLPYNYFSIGSGIETAGIWVIQLPEVVLNAPNTISETSGKIGASLSRTEYFLIGYFIMSSLMLFMLIWRILQLALMARKYKSVSRDGIKVVLLPDGYIPFSFFNHVFIPENISEQHFARVMAHERAHCLKRHSWDVLFYELLFVFFWFHPAVYFLRHEAKTLHEYEADHLAMRQFDKADYQQTLLACALAGKAIALANPFNVSPLKKRIMKMNQKTQTSRFGNWIKLAVITPFIAAALLLQSCYNESEDVQKQEERTLMDEIKEKALEAGAKFKPAEDYAVEKGQQREDSVWTVVQELPKYPGGTEAMFKFLIANINYPEQAKKDTVEGRVFVNFIVEPDGQVTNVNVLRGIGSGCDEEAVRVVEMMPAWTPGYEEGEPVRVSFNIPIRFSLSGKK